MKQLGSNLATLLGLVLLGALTLLAAYLRLPALLGAALALWLLCLAAYVWARLALRKLEISVEQREVRAFPGEELALDAGFVNAKFLPLIWVESRLPLEKDSCVAPLEEEMPARDDEPLCLRESFLWVMPQQRLRWRQRARAVRRGVLRVEALELASGDGFGLVDRSRSVPLDHGFRFVVYPRVLPLDPHPILRRMSELERWERGLYTDPTLIKNIRDYQPGDSVRHINWRLLARQGKIQINVREAMAMRRVCLVLDLESFSYVESYEYGGETHTRRCVDGEALERMLSLLASVIVAVHEHGVLCSLLLPGEGESPWRLCTPETRETQVVELLTVLAEVDYQGGLSALPEEGLPQRLARLGQCFLFTKTLGDKPGRLAKALDTLAYQQVLLTASDEQLAADPHLITETDLTGL